MDENNIKSLIKEEVARQMKLYLSSASSVFPITRPHNHDGVSNIQISQQNLIEFIPLPLPNHSSSTSGSGIFAFNQNVSGKGNLSFPIIEGNQSHNLFQGGIGNNGNMVLTFTPDNSAYLYFYLVGSDETLTTTLTGAPSAGATSATLSSAWGNISDTYTVTFSTGEIREVTFTNNSTSISWSGGLSAGNTATIQVTLLGTGMWWGVQLPLYIRN